MCEQMEQDPDPDKIPPEIEDFPSDIQKAIVLYNKLGDRVYSDVGYIGKDYTQLPVFMDAYEVEDKKLFLEALLKLDTKMIQKSAAELKAKHDEIRRKSK